MLNEEKVKLMTGIAMFEKKEGKKIFPIHRYFKSDYISRHLLTAFFGYTLCCLLIICLWILYRLEQLLTMMNVEQVFALGKRFALFYLLGLVVYLLITFLVYKRRYEYASKGLRVYVAKLKRLEKRYEYQTKVREMTKEGTRHDRTAGV